MPEIGRTTRLIHAPDNVVWHLLTDTNQWPRWGPSVRAVDCPTQFIGADTRGRVQTALGLWLPFQIVQWEEGRAWSWKVAGIRATGHRVYSHNPDACQVTFDVPSWALPYLPVCATALRRLDRLATGSPR
jgi:hypothetical protein